MSIEDAIKNGRKYKIAVRAAWRSPLNTTRWNLALVCGHELWVSAKRAPKSVYCAQCAEEKR